MDRRRLSSDIDRLIKAARKLQEANRVNDRGEIETHFAFIEFVVKDIEEDIWGGSDG